MAHYEVDSDTTERTTRPSSEEHENRRGYKARRHRRSVLLTLGLVVVSSKRGLSSLADPTQVAILL